MIEEAKNGRAKMKKSYLSYFFTYETKLPDGMGFSLFGPWHMIWLLAITAGCVFYLFFYKRCSGKGKRRLDGISAGSLMFWIAARMIYIVIIHEDLLYELPLHLCSMAGILCFIHFLTGCKMLGQVLYTICLPGTVLALLFPNWNFYPVIHFITIESFLFHMGIVLYVTGQLMSHKIVPGLSKLYQVILFLTAVVIPVFWFDKCFNVNYMFVNWPSAGSPLVFLADKMGNPGYLAGYGALVLLCMFLMDLGYYLHSIRGKRD